MKSFFDILFFVAGIGLFIMYSISAIRLVSGADITFSSKEIMFLHAWTLLYFYKTIPEEFHSFKSKRSDRT